MLELSDRKFQLTMINMLRALRDKLENIQESLGGEKETKNEMKKF